MNGFLYFRASNSQFGDEIWRTDGTEAKTVMVKDLREGKKGSTIRNVIVAENMLYFSADDGKKSCALWKSSGTREGTVKIKSLNIAGSYDITYVETD